MSQTQEVFGSAPKSVHNKQLMHVQDQKPNGTDGGSSVAGDNDRDLNNVLVNEISGASLSNNEVTLPAGEYYIEAKSVLYIGSGTRNKIKTSADVELLRGPNVWTRDGTTNSTVVPVSGRITLAAPTAIKVSSATTVSTAANGLGRTGGDPGNEVYTDLRIWKLDSNIATEIADPTMTLVRPLFHAQEQYPSGTNGANGVVGDNDRVINSVLTNEITGASLAANEINLPAGTFEIDCHVIYGREQDNTQSTGLQTYIVKSDDTKLLIGMSGNQELRNQNMEYSVKGRITLSAPDSIKVVSYLQRATGAWDFGMAVGSGENEVYLDIKVYQLDAVKQTEVVIPAEVLTKPLLQVQERQASGVKAGQGTNNAWAPRDLNTIVTNEILGSSLGAGGLVSLPAGEYYVNTVQTIGRSSSTICGVAVDGVVTLRGTNTSGPSDGDADYFTLNVTGKLVLTKTSDVTLVYHKNQNDVSGTASSLGPPKGLAGTEEVYSSMDIFKLDTNLEVQRYSDPDGLARQRSEERRVGKECRSRWARYH